MSAVILACFAVPSLFGFQNFVQWGAMYDDRWCSVLIYEKNPHEFPDTRMMTLVPGSNVQRVYSAPTHNRRSCMAMARTYCGTRTHDGWTVLWVEPKFQSEMYMGKTNVCELDLPSLDYWFFNAT